MRDEVAGRGTSVQGRLSLGIPPSLFDTVTVPGLLEYRALYPDVALSIVEGISSSVYEQVLSGRLDVGIVLSTESMQGLQQRALFKEALFLAGPPDQVPDGPSISLQELTALPLVLTQRANAMRAVLEDALRSAGLSCPCIMEANSTRVQTALVAGGAGFTVLSYAAIANEVEAGRLAGVPIDALEVTWTLIHSRECALGVAAQRLVEVLLAQADRRAASGRWPGFSAAMAPS